MDEGNAGCRPTWQRGRGIPCGPFAHVIDWGQLWAYARSDLGLSDREFWGLTLYELDLLSLRHRRQQEREDRRACVAAWMLLNINRDAKHKPEPFRLEEVVAWLGHGFQRAPAVARATEPPTVDELRRKIDVVHLLHRGLYGDNGQQEREG